MNSNLDHVYLSSVDEERFGIKTARAPNVTLDNLPSILDFCKVNNVILLIARSLTTEIRAAQTMEREGFILMDTLVYYAYNLVKAPIPADIGKVLVRIVRPGEEEEVKRVASESFHGYFGHYHADERLDPAKCDEAYEDWAYRSCISRDVAEEVLVAEMDGAIVGFAPMRLNSPEEGEWIVGSVSPKAQGRGVFRSLTINTMKWCLSKGTDRMVASTLVNNFAVQKVWARLGFEPSHSYYTFHKWFDKK